MAGHRGAANSSASPPHIGAIADLPATLIDGWDLRAAITRLSKDQREAILLRFFVGLTTPEVAALLRTPGAVMTPGVLHGRSRMMYQFDAYVRRFPSGLRGLLGIGSPGSAIFVKSFTSPPTVKDLQAIKRAVEDISMATFVPPARVIAVWRAEGDAKLSDEAYEFVTKEVVRVTLFGKMYECSLQSIEENPDGTYDFIPFIPETPSAALPMAPAASA